MISSSIPGLVFRNPSIQMISIDYSTDLTLTGISQNNLEGDTGDSSTEAANTDAFDISSSTRIIITGSTINNQDE
jgi:galacturan 1,4-alpha-galacturonidase